MILCRVTGDVYATQKDRNLEGYRMLLCQPVELDGETARGASFIALDRVVDAGPGDLILVHKEGGGARIMFGNEKIPIQTVVVAIVDDLEIDRRAGDSVIEQTRRASAAESSVGGDA